MQTRPVMAIGGALLAVAAGAAAMWAAAPSIDVEPLPLAAPATQTAASDADHEPVPQARRKRPQTRRQPRDPAVAAEQRKQKEQALVAKSSKLTHAERAVARKDYRTDRMSDLDQRLDTHAANAGWDPETTETVRAVLTETTDRITAVLTRVENGNAPWENLKGELRDFRLEQADQVREILGPEDFDSFVQGMAFERFDEEEPIWGRLDR